VIVIKRLLGLSAWNYHNPLGHSSAMDICVVDWRAAANRLGAGEVE